MALTAAMYEAFWSGLAAADAGNIEFTSASSGKNLKIVDVTFATDFTGAVTLADGTIINITEVIFDDAGNITKIYMNDGKTAKVMSIGYDANGYLILVGTTTIQNISSLGITTYIDGQDATAYPDGTTFTVIPEPGYDALSSVTIEGDDNLKSYNIKKDITIYGVTGTEEFANLQEKSAEPGYDDILVEPDEGYNGLSSVTVSGDTRLIPENIKKDVIIFGVTGTLEGTTYEDVNNKKF